MTDTTDGGPAFPTENDHQSAPHLWHHSGMTLRDYFAAKAMDALIVTPHRWINEGAGELTHAREFAHEAYLIADEMLKARLK